METTSLKNFPSTLRPHLDTTTHLCAMHLCAKGTRARPLLCPWDDAPNARAYVVPSA